MIPMHVWELALTWGCSSDSKNLVWFSSCVRGVLYIMLFFITVFLFLAFYSYVSPLLTSPLLLASNFLTASASLLSPFLSSPLLTRTFTVFQTHPRLGGCLAQGSACCGVWVCRRVPGSSTKFWASSMVKVTSFAHNELWGSLIISGA